MPEKEMSFKDVEKSLGLIENNFRWRFGNANFKARDMQINIQINFKGQIAFEDKFSRNEEFSSEIMRAIKNGKDPIEAMAVLLGIGSREIYSHRYKDLLDTYFRKNK